MLLNRKKWGTILCAALITGMGLFQGRAYAEPEIQLAKYLQSVKIGGDYRLRFDNEHYKKTTTADRARFRMRLRLNTDFYLPNDVAVKTTFASGTGEATSTNQTFGNLNSQKALWVDKAYLEWGALSFLKLQGGRMANPLWTLYSTDAVWDADVNPEGFSQSLNYLLGGKANLFVNGLQMVSAERSGDIHDGYLFTEQIGAEVQLPMESRLKVAYSYNDWKNTSQSNFAQTKVQEGNRRVTVNGSANTLASKFGVSEINAELSSWVGRLPLSLQGTFVQNNRVSSSFVEKENKGYQTGAILGKAKDAHTWELAYFYKYLQSDATVADVSDSDFGAGGTNRVGHIMWAAYSPTEWLNLKTKYFITKNIDKTFPGATGDINRIQVDAQVKF